MLHLQRNGVWHEQAAGQHGLYAGSGGDGSRGSRPARQPRKVQGRGRALAARIGRPQSLAWGEQVAGRHPMANCGGHAKYGHKK